LNTKDAVKPGHVRPLSVTQRSTAQQRTYGQHPGTLSPTCGAHRAASRGAVNRPAANGAVMLFVSFETIQRIMCFLWFSSFIIFHFCLT